MAMHIHFPVYIKKKRYGQKPAATEKTAVQAEQVTCPCSSTHAIITSPCNEMVHHIWNCQRYLKSQLKNQSDRVKQYKYILVIWLFLMVKQSQLTQPKTNQERSEQQSQCETGCQQIQQGDCSAEFVGYLGVGICFQGRIQSVCLQSKGEIFLKDQY